MKNLMKEKENFDDIKVKEYIKRYLKELQRHFDLSDKKICMILFELYKELLPQNFFQNWILMVKSSCKNKFKRKIKNEA